MKEILFIFTGLVLASCVCNRRNDCCRPHIPEPKIVPPCGCGKGFKPKKCELYPFRQSDCNCN